MPKILTVADVKHIAANGEFEELLDAVETEHLDFKSELYNLDQDSEKQELAKDISGFANAGGGLIVIGVRTKKDLAVLGDFVASVRPVPAAQFNQEQYQSVIRDWIYPRLMPQIDWVTDPRDSSRGLVLIDVPVAEPSQRPLLVKRYVTEGEKRIDTVIGYFERRRTNVDASSVQELHSIMRAGLDSEILKLRYLNIQETLQTLVDAQVHSKLEAETWAGLNHQAGAFKREKLQALAAANLESVPNLLLAAYPTAPVEFPGMFDRRDAGFLQVLNEPPKLQGNGWDLSIDSPMENVHGQLRRRNVPGWKLLQTSREGLLLFLARGDEAFLSYSLHQREDLPYLINPFVLAHCVYVFALFCQQVYKFAEPLPVKIVYVIQLRNLANNGKPALLHPNHGKLNRYPASECYRPMPFASHGFEVTCGIDIQPDQVAFQLIAPVYTWFGFDQTEIPYTRCQDATTLIDEVSLFS